MWSFFIRILIVACFLLTGEIAHAFDVPRDLPTFEVLLDMHKNVKKEEDEAMKKIATSFADQTLIAKGTNLFNNARTTLDTKMNSAYSYIILLSSLSYTANSLYRLADEYKDFSVNTYKYVTKKPFVAWYFADANVALEREIKQLVKLYGIYAASGANVWRAAMDEKIMLLNNLRNSIERCRNIIYRTSNYCRIMVNGTWEPDYIWEILNSEVRNEIVEGVVNHWNKQ